MLNFKIYVRSVKSLVSCYLTFIHAVKMHINRSHSLSLSLSPTKHIPVCKKKISAKSNTGLLGKKAALLLDLFNKQGLYAYRKKWPVRDDFF